jgi:hypothetical protein
MVKCGVFFAVRTEFLNIIQTSFGFKGLKWILKKYDLKARTEFNLLKIGSNGRRCFCEHGDELCVP